MPYVVGLTGGIGTGKSSAGSLFEKCGATIVDADIISHKLTSKNQPALIEIRRSFGDQFLNEEGELNRPLLRQRIFSDTNAKIQLEQILHPLIRSEITSQIASSITPYVLLIVPLLLESNQYRASVQRILVIDCDEAEQIKRTMKRSQMNSDEVQAIMATQLSRAERLKYADDILTNNGDLDSLQQQVLVLHSEYLALAQNCQ